MNAKAAMQMSESANSTFDKVREIIADSTGYDQALITMESDIAADIGVAGDDGDLLFMALDEAFDVDWAGLDLGIHFGDEGVFQPLPWHLKNSFWMYESQPCRVSDVVMAVETGKWPGTPIVPISKAEYVALYRQSMSWVILWGGLMIAGLLLWFFTRR